MSQPLVYLDTSRVREGRLAQLKTAIEVLSKSVEQNEPRLISYGAYFNEAGSEMTVVHIHADSASLDHHMQVAAPLFKGFVDLVELTSIHIYGEPSAKALRQLRDKVRLLGSGEVIVHAPHAGFGRFAQPEHRTTI